jgi:hypothetical protein
MTTLCRQGEQREEATMDNHQSGLGAMGRRISLAVAMSCLWLVVGFCLPVRAAPAQQNFASPEQAADALAAAWHSGHTADVLAIFGPAGENLVSSHDRVAERQARARLAALYDEGHRIETDGSDKAVLILGKDEWPYPIPLVRQDTAWRFDAQAGGEQILDRRIGHNELNAIAVCRSYVEVQRDYAAADPTGSGLHEYAQKVTSTAGKRDGLYWPATAGSDESPLGSLVAAAEARGYHPVSSEGRAPFEGYFYRILTQQDESAPGGAKNYIVNGHMTGGFALLAFPAKYGSSGVMTFIVNQDGIVFQKNLGPDTSGIARRITSYNPDTSWQPVAP